MVFFGVVLDKTSRLRLTSAEKRFLCLAVLLFLLGAAIGSLRCVP